MTSRRQHYDIPVAAAVPSPNLEARNSQYGAQPTAQPRALERVLQRMHAIDDRLGELGQPLKPYLPPLGRALVVSTFIEDSLRLVSQWGPQNHYLTYSRGVPRVIVFLFLVSNVLCMLAGSVMVVAKKRLAHACSALLYVIVSQAVVYGLLLDAQFFFRNLSVIGGLLLVVSDVFAANKRRLGLPGLPQLDNKDRVRYLQLAGRTLLILLYIVHVLRAGWSPASAIFNLLGVAACGLVVVGFRARLSASFLVVLLEIQNLTSNNYWTSSRNNVSKDYLRYQHFQTLSIIGGLILLVNMGAGRLSIDEKKKVY